MKRTESSEMPTIVVPRGDLPPISAGELADAVIREMHEDRPTLVPCPACPPCACCLGDRMVTPERAERFRDEETT